MVLNDDLINKSLDLSKMPAKYKDYTKHLDPIAQKLFIELLLSDEDNEFYCSRSPDDVSCTLGDAMSMLPDKYLKALVIIIYHCH